MDKASLEAALKDTAKRFEDFSNQKADLTKQTEDINAEMLRLQGEYRGYENLLKGLEEPKDAKDSRRAERTK